MHPKGLQISTPTDTTIVLVRTFDAPRELVWEAMFRPEKMRRWMLPPPGWTLTVCVCEPRVGGELRLAWKDDHSDPVMTLHGVFTEVVLHVRIQHTETMTLGTGATVGRLVETHEFTEADGITTMRITQTYDSKADRDGALASGMDQGMEAGFQRLEALASGGMSTDRDEAHR